MTAKIEHSNGIQKPLKEFESYRVDFLTRLLKGLEQGQTRKELCNTLNLKNNALQYHINRLLCRYQGRNYPSSLRSGLLPVMFRMTNYFCGGFIAGKPCIVTGIG